MNIDSIKISKEVSINLSPKWISISASLDETDDVQASLKKLESEIDRYIKESGESVTGVGLPEVQYSKANGHDMGVAILSCDSLKTLESYKLIIKSRPDLKEVYDKKYAELSK